MGTPEQRRNRRVYLNCMVQISHPDIGTRLVQAKDFSDTGIFLMVKEDLLPPIGTVVKGQVQGLTEEAPVLDMEVVRAAQGGVGLRFCNPDDEKKLH